MPCREFLGAAGPDARHWVRLCNCLGFPRDHRHGSSRQHHDAGCARGQTRPPPTSCQYTNDNSAEGGANPCAECKSRGHTICNDPRTGTEGAGQASTDLCIGTTRPGADSAGLSANPDDTGQCRNCTGGCRPCVRADCIRCDYTACPDCDRGADCKP